MILGKSYKKRISLALAVILAFTSMPVYAAETPEPKEETPPLKHSVIYMLEDADGGFTEKGREEFEVSTDSITVTPEPLELYTTPDVQEIDISSEGETEIKYYRESFLLSVVVKDVSGNEIRPYVIEDENGTRTGYDEADIYINDEKYENPIEAKWGSVLAFRADTHEGYGYESLALNGTDIEDIKHFEMPAEKAELVLTLKAPEADEDMDGTVSDNEADREVSDNKAEEQSKTVSDDAIEADMPDDTVSGSSVSDNTVSGDSVSKNSVSDNDSEITVSEDSVSENMPDVEAVSEDSAGEVSENETEPVIPADTIDISGNALTTLSGDGITGNPSFGVTNTVLSANKTVDEKTGNKYLTESQTSYTLTLVKNQKTKLMTPDAWETADKKTAQVSQTGKITGKRIGETSIYRYGTMPTTFTVKVVDPKSLSKGVKGYVDGDQITIGKGKSIQAAIVDKWVSENPKVVKVNKKTGEVVAKKGGQTTVTVTGTHNRTYNIKVEDPDILVKNKKLSISVGDIIDVSGKLIDTSLPITYQVAKPDIAEVDVWGHLKGLKAGSTKLYALVNGRKYAFTVKVTNNSVSGGMVNADTVYLLPKKKFKLNVKFPKGETKRAVTYTLESVSGGTVQTSIKDASTVYSDSVITLSDKGVIKALSDGEAYVNVAIEGGSSYKVHVIVEGDKVAVSDNITINVGEYFYINPDIAQTVVWKSSNQKIATVNEFGVIRGIKKGKCKVSGKVSGKNYKITVNVVNAGADKQYDADYVLKEEVIVWEDALNPRVVRYLDLSGQWKLKYIYNITYDYNGGEAVNPSTYTSNDEITLQAPVKENYVFVGWTGSNGDDIQKDVSFSHVTGHKYYVAHYESGQYKILYNLDGGQLDRANPNVYRHESDDIILNNPEKTGYVFDGWQQVKVADGSMTEEKVGTLSMDACIPYHSAGDKGFNAVWHPIHYEVAYEPNGGSLDDQGGEEPAGGPLNASSNTGRMDNTDVTYDEAFDLSENEYERDGYEFVGWSEGLPTNEKKYDDRQHITQNLTTVDDDVVDMYAAWRQEVYSISYNLAGGRLEYLNPPTYTYDNDDFTLNNPVMPGFKFIGWSGTGIGNEMYDVEENVVVPHNSKGDRHYTAHWEPITYKIRFDGNGGKASGYPNDMMPDIDVNYGVSFNLAPNKYVREGCTFIGWASSPFGEKIYDDEELLETNLATHADQVVTLYAVWGVNNYSLSVNKGAHVKTVDNRTNYLYGEMVNLTAEADDGYSITGWSGDFESNSQVLGFIMPAHSVSLNVTAGAKWYQIYLNVNGGTCAESVIQRQQDAIFGTLPTPVKDGCTFLGWFKEQTDPEPVSYNEIFTKDVTTLTAMWRELAEYPYTVNHYQQQLDGLNDDNYVCVKTDNLKALKGTKVSPSVNSYTGFISPTVQTAYVAPDGSTEINYYYKRAASKVTVSKADDGIAAVKGSDTYTFGQPVTVEAELAEGYSFDKFDGDYVFETRVKTFSMPATSVSLNAHSMGTVTLNANGGAFTGGSSTKTKDVRMGSAYGDLTVPSRTGWDFLGYFTEANAGEAVSENSVVSTTKPHTIYAHWKGQETTYLVKYWTLKLDGVASAHNGDNYDNFRTEQGNAIVGSRVTPEVIDIDGFTAPNHQTVDVLPNGVTVINYYYVRNKYTLAADSTPGVSEVRGTGSYLYGSSVTITAIVDKSYDFDEWTGSDANELISNKTLQSVTFTMPARNVRIKPTVKTGKYTVMFHGNNGTTEKETQEIQCGTYTNLAGNMFTRTGYTFKGWSDNADSADIKYTNGQRVKNLADKDETVHLYAIWTPGEYTVTFSATTLSGQSFVFTKKVTYGSTYGDLPVLESNEDKVFDGWYLNGVKITPETVVNITSDESCEARFIDADDVCFVVYHYRKKLGASPSDHSLSSYTLAETSYETGVRGSEMAIPVRHYEGYRDPDVRSYTVPDEGYIYIYYYYERASYRVTLTSTNGVSIAGDTTFMCDYGQKFTIEAELEDNYSFAGWFGINGTEMTYINQRATITMPGHDIELQATAKAMEYTLFVVKDDGTADVTIDGRSVQSMKVPFGQEVSINSIPAAGYSFKKWMTVGVPQSSDQSYTFIMPADDVTLISTTVADPFRLHLEAKEHINSVSIYDSGMTDSMMTAGSVVYVKADPEKYYHFNGWSGSLTSMNPIFTFTMPSEDVDIWCSAQENSYKVHFDPNEETPSYATTHVLGSMDDEEFICYHGKALDKCRFTREGYNFMGWALDPTGSVKYTDEQIISDTAERNLSDELDAVVTLYAVWEPIQYTLRFVPYETGYNFETGEYFDNSADTTSHISNPAGMPDQTVTFDIPFSIDYNRFKRAGYEKDGYEGVEGFMGWSRDDTDHKATYTAASVSDDTVVYDKNTILFTPEQDVSVEGNLVNLTSTEGDVINLYPVWKPVKVGYFIEQYRQKLEDVTLYDRVLRDGATSFKDEATGLYPFEEQYTDEIITLSAPSLDGSTITPETASVSEKIRGDGQTVFRFDYSRNTYHLTLVNGSNTVKVWLGDDKNDTEADMKFGEEVQIYCQPKTTGYDFDGWYEVLAGGVTGRKIGNISGYNYVMKSADITLRADCVPGLRTYNVVIKEENVAGTGYATDSTRSYSGQALTGSTVTQTVADNITGFQRISSGTQSITMEGTGSDTIEFKFNRRSYTVSIGKDGNIKSVDGAGTYKYGASVGISAVPADGWTGDNTFSYEPSADGWYYTDNNTKRYRNLRTTTHIYVYSFSKWTGYDLGSSKSTKASTSFTMPAQNVSLTATGSVKDNGSSSTSKAAEQTKTIVYPNVKVRLRRNITGQPVEEDKTVTVSDGWNGSFVDNSNTSNVNRITYSNGNLHVWRISTATDTIQMRNRININDGANPVYDQVTIFYDFSTTISGEEKWS